MVANRTTAKAAASASTGHRANGASARGESVGPAGVTTTVVSSSARGGRVIGRMRCSVVGSGLLPVQYSAWRTGKGPDLGARCLGELQSAGTYRRPHSL